MSYCALKYSLGMPEGNLSGGTRDLVCMCRGARRSTCCPRA